MPGTKYLRLATKVNSYTTGNEGFRLVKSMVSTYIWAASR